MKILKITLQNINSLKSDTPIVIDFEAEQFKDVGLYAITGSTGAGKTTILDAITIALYHQVPRFNASNVKAGLVDVISYGADEAFSRVVFENNGEQFEASWTMRLVTKGGKKLTHPQEEVRLKNITTDQIIAEKKTDLKIEVERVTKLNYNQFLRSVMLAQGEFASFLSAKGTEKAKLLEQITGEEIYKKIGEVVLQKKGDEDKILNDIKSKINSEDLLTTEQRTTLTAEQKVITQQISQLDIQLGEVAQVISWHGQVAELNTNKSALQIQLDDLESKKKASQPDLLRLQYNEKAAPFKEIIDSIGRVEKDIDKKKSKLIELEQGLEVLAPKIDAAKKQEETDSTKQKETEENLDLWLPKLEDLSKLDATILSEKKNKEKLDHSLVELNQAIDKLNNGVTVNQANQSKLQKDANTIEAFLKTQKNIPDIEKQFTTWSTELTILKNEKENIQKETELCERKEVELSQSREAFQTKNNAIEKENTDLLAIKEQLSAISDQLEKSVLVKLLDQKDQLVLQINNWNTLKDISEQHTKNTEIWSQFAIDKKRKITTLQELERQEESIKSSRADAKTAVQDAEKIVSLEHTIKSFAEERTKLEEGKPCNLCGATEHPFVEKYQALDESASQTELDKRKVNLEKIEHERNEVEKQLTKTVSQIDHFSARIIEIEEELKSLNERGIQLDLGCAITDWDGVNTKLTALTLEINSVETLITNAQLLQTQKNKKEEEYTLRNEQVNANKTELAALKEKGGNQASELSEKKEALKTAETKTEMLESDLSEQLVDYNLTVPSLENTTSFIANLKTKILDFNTKSKTLDRINAEILELKINLTHAGGQLSKQQESVKKQKEEVLFLKETITNLSKQRAIILPLEISLDAKRTSLQKIKGDAIEMADQARKRLQSLRLEEKENTTHKGSNQKDLSTYEKELISYHADLKIQIKASDFHDKEEIIAAQLSPEEKAVHSKTKKELEDKTAGLDALKTKIEEESVLLDQQKSFDTTEQDALNQQNEFKSKKDIALKQSGEIAQKFTLDNQIKDRNKSVFEQITIQEQKLKKWVDLLSLLGGSKDAFNTYVQRLTLQNLIGFANLHLYKLNKRYALKMEEKYKPGEELNFKLIDHYQTDQMRYVDTSSGGEKFLISLSLALGLSDLASNNVNIDSLFIDEGFGTLDNHTLETVISSLETLQAQGKMIGIISHVENLKERIPTQIQILKKSNGISVVELV